MDLDLDGGTILYAVGIVFALAALAYFVRDVVFALSITVKAALLFVTFLAFLLGGIAIERDVLDRVALVLAAAAYVVFLGYVVIRYDLEATGVFLALAGSAGVFVTLGYVLRQRRPSISNRTATSLAVVLLAVAVLLVGVDVAMAGVSATANLEETVTVTAPPDAPTDRDVIPVEATVGTLVVTNEGPFTRPLSLPSPSACVVGNDGVSEQRVHLQYQPGSYERTDRIAGGESQTYRLLARLPLQNDTDAVTYAVERGEDCETPRSQPTLVVDLDVSDGTN